MDEGGFADEGGFGGEDFQDMDSDEAAELQAALLASMMEVRGLPAGMWGALESRRSALHVPSPLTDSPHALSALAEPAWRAGGAAG